MTETIEQKTTEFYVGQVFDDVYPPEAAMWCNDHQKIIVEREGKYVIEEIPQPSLEEARSEKLNQLHYTFNDWRQSKCTLISSLGFEVDADERAKQDVDGLILKMKKRTIETEMFRDANNEYHNLSLNDLETLQLEIIDSAQQMYKDKWQFEQAIDQATSNQQLDAIIIKMTKCDFSKR